jgi:1,4-dihydroxy-2-naphthoate octaprenyltransferase
MQQRLQLFVRGTRAATLPVMIIPVVIGSLLAWQQGNPFSWPLFALTLCGALAAHLGANVVNDIFDFGQGADQAAYELAGAGTTLPTGSPLLLSGELSPAAYRWLALSCFALALLCALLLSVVRPWVLLFAGLGFALSLCYVAPPLRLAYLGRGLGEIDIFLSFGPLPLAGAFYVQAGTITPTAMLVSLPIGLYTMAVLYFHHFLHWRGDQRAGKITPVVALGEQRARVVGALILLIIALTTLILALTQVLPWYSAVAALTIIPVQLALRRASGDLLDYLGLMASNLRGNLLAALIIVIALLIRGTTHL